jgi:thymidylate kinase
MVSTINNTQTKDMTEYGRGLIVELIGVAGVGKSTLYKAFKNKNYPWLICDQVLPVWNISATPFFISNILSLTPLLMRLEMQGDRLLKRREVAFMAMLNGWHGILRKKADKSNKVIILDQGPISMMAYLSVWGPKSLKNSHIQSWWETVYKNWSHTLDFLVYLDTRDEIIIDRIRTRLQNHHLKEETNDVMGDWIMRYRWLYKQILNRFEANGHKVRVVRIDSGLNSTEEILNNLVSIFSSDHIESSK